MSDYYASYGVVLAVLVAGALLVAVAFTTAWLVGPSKPNREKLLTYECGIDPVGQGRRVAPFSPRTAHGLGLGLTICSTIVETHGGNITLANHDDGAGAVARLSLPAHRTLLAAE